MMKRILLCILYSGFAVAGPLAESFDEAKQLALELESEPENEQHQNEVLVPYFGKKYALVLKRCFDAVPDPDMSKFEFVVAIGNGGQVMRIYKERDTNVSKCMFSSLKSEKFPAPIIVPYYLNIAMSFDE